MPKRVGRPKMPFERIVATALEIVDAQGADALTLRALAQTLGSSTATLYRHVDSRADLLGHLVDRMIGEIEVDAATLEGLEWSAACDVLARGLFAAAARHPNIAPLLVETIPTGPHAMAFRELSLSTLLANGFTAHTARTLTAALGRFVIGFATQLREDPTQVADDERAADRLRSADPALYPATHATASHGTSQLSEEFELGLDLLLRGMRDYAHETGARAEGDSPPPP